MSTLIEEIAGLTTELEMLGLKRKLLMRTARERGISRPAIARAMNLTEEQVDYLLGDAKHVAAKKSRPSTKTELPGLSAGEYALAHGLSRSAVQKRIAAGTLKTEEITVGERTFRRILE